MPACLKGRRHRKLAAALAGTAAAVVTMTMAPHLFKTPQNTSILTRHAWVHELLSGHPRRFHNMMGMSKDVFWKLARELQTHADLRNTKHITLKEQLALFLHMCRTGGSHRDMQEQFQHSPDTISKRVVIVLSQANDSDGSCRIFHRLLGMITSACFYNRYVKLPPCDQVPNEIRNNPKLFPFFEHCRGAIDGSHIDAFVPADILARYRNRKGHISQNILAACTFCLLFCYVLAGWEGSASDSRIFEDARHHGLAISPGTYYLGDAGFPLCDALLVPYRGVHYHLQEWGRAPQR
jgi:hypothetical protein